VRGLHVSEYLHLVILRRRTRAASNLEVDTGNTSACKKLLEAQSHGYQP